MEVIACTCADGCGLPHTHLGRKVQCRAPYNPDKVHWLDELSAKMNPDWVPTGAVRPDAIRLWVNWKAVARALVLEST